MERKDQLSYLIVVILSFLFCFAFIQSIRIGYERSPISISIYGKNMKGVNSYFNNKLIKNAPLQITDSSSIKYTLEVPTYSYIRNLKIVLDYEKLLEIHKIELQGNGNKVTIKPSDIPNYFRYSNYLYNTRSNKFTQIDSSKILNNNKLTITSIDISDFTNELYIKRATFTKTILLSTLFAILITIIFYFIFTKYSSRASIKIVTSIAIIVIISVSIYSIYNQENISNEDLSEKSIFEIIKPHTPDNLIYNGDFKYGMLFWTAAADSTNLQIIDTPFGKGIKVKRGDGDGGYWSLRYVGRPIIYHKGHTYQIKFKFKTIKGESVPFNLGWWIGREDIDYGAHKLKFKSTPIIDNWFAVEANYEFKREYKNLVCLLNSLKDYSEIIVVDIRIYDLSRNSFQNDFIDQTEN